MQRTPTNTPKYDERVTVWTIGHSNRTIETFTNLLIEHEIKVVVDVRRFPTSKVEHFKKEEMEKWLSEHGIKYVFLGEEFGGYRRGGYKAYMETDQFKEGVEKFIEIAKKDRTCIMCMEPNPKYCHRRFISKHLEEKDVEVVHILKAGQASLLTFAR